MKKTGEILKKAREEKGLSLNEVGLSLKISSKVLKAIEEGDEKNLPAKTFLRGFVKSYATYLRLDADKVLETFYEEFGSTRPQPYIRQSEHTKEVAEDKTSEPVSTTSTPTHPQENSPEPESTATVTPIRHSRPEPVVQSTPTATPSPSRAQPYNPLNEKKNTKTIAVVVVLAVLVGLIIFTKKMIDKYSKEAEVPTSQVAQAIEGATPVATGSTTPGAPEAPAPVESMPPSTNAAVEATPGPSPLSNLTKPAHTPVPATMTTPSANPTATPSVAAISPALAAKPSPSATPMEKKAEEEAATPAASPSPTPKEEKNKPVELIVEALDTVDIEYSAPNGKPQKIKLSAEQVHTFKSRSGLRISFSNGGAVNLIVNGKDVGIPGDLGKPIKLSY